MRREPWRDYDQETWQKLVRTAAQNECGYDIDYPLSAEQREEIINIFASEAHEYVVAILDKDYGKFWKPKEELVFDEERMMFVRKQDGEQQAAA